MDSAYDFKAAKFMYWKYYSDWVICRRS